MLPLFPTLQRNFYLQKSFHKPIFDILNRFDIDKKGHKIKASPFGDDHWKRAPFFQKKGKAFLHFLKVKYQMKKGMLFDLSQREKRVKKINLLHFPVFTSKNFVILKLPEPSTDCNIS